MSFLFDRLLLFIIVQFTHLQLKTAKQRRSIWIGDNGSCTLNALGNWDRGKSISTYMQVGRIKSTSGFSMLNYVVGTVTDAYHHLQHVGHICLVLILPIILSPPPKSIPGIVASIRQKYCILYLSNNRIASPLMTSYTIAYIGRLYTTPQIFSVVCYLVLVICVLYF